MAQKSIMVEKRDGTKTPYDVSKIKKSIQMATEGQDVNPLELESKFDEFLKPGITTKSIQLNLIQHAVQLATPHAPDWLNVAGRALAMDEWASFPLRGKSFKEIVHFNINNGHYAKEIINFYSNDDLDELGAYIKHNRDLDHSYASLITAKKKYLGKFELNQHMHMVNAMRFGQYEPSMSRIRFVKDVYDALSRRKISLATPFLSNLRKGGNIASCFIITIEDDLESIFDNVKRIAQISKSGGGIGVFLGYIRAKGSTVNGYANAAGSIAQWVKIINDTAVAVNQSFSADTIVETDRGPVMISEITTADKVLTNDGTFCQVENIFTGKNNTAIYEIETESGTTSITAGHPVMVVRSNVGGMTEDDILMGLKNGSLVWKWVPVSEVAPDDYIITVER